MTLREIFSSSWIIPSFEKRWKTSESEWIFVGFIILDPSKVLMSNFHYSYIMYIVSKYWSRSLEIVVYRLRQPLLWCKKTWWFVSWFPTRPEILWYVRLPKRKFPYSERDQKVLGKMEDETHGVPIGEFIGLWPKMNTTAKGLPRTSPRHKDCKSCLFEKQMQIAQIRSENHQIYSLNLIKTSLSPYMTSATFQQTVVIQLLMETNKKL